MQLEQLEIFVAVARCGSFSAAAKQLYISHSTTSRAISALEDELGVRLFCRGNRVNGLTAPGETLLEEAVKLLDAAEAAKKRVRAAAEREKKNTGEKET